MPRAGTPGVPWQGVFWHSKVTCCLFAASVREGWMFNITSPFQTKHYGFSMLHFRGEFKIKMVICPILYYLHYSINNTILLQSFLLPQAFISIKENAYDSINHIRPNKTFLCQALPLSFSSNTLATFSLLSSDTLCF